MKQMEQIGISTEHFQNVDNINKYLQDHRVNQLFNVSQYQISSALLQKFLASFLHKIQMKK